MSEDAVVPDYDVVIAGGGPAGLAGARMLGRVRRRVLVCDTGEGRNAPVEEAHGYFTRDGSRRLLLATGLVDDLPDVDGLAELWGRSAFDMAHKAIIPMTLGQIVFAAASGELAGAAIDQDLLFTDMPELPSPLRAVMTRIAI